jgi:hypothetical protein
LKSNPSKPAIQAGTACGIGAFGARPLTRPRVLAEFIDLRKDEIARTLS